jgi:hypothetical protein
MNNTFYNSYGNDITLDGVERQGSVIINNLSVDCANTFLVIEDEIFNQEHGIYDYNMVVNPGNQSTLGVKNGLNLNFQNDVTGVSDALLVDPANRNFNLQSNSPAKGVGNDYIAEANTSSYLDIGASQSQEPQGGGVRQIIRPPIINIVPG